MDKIYQVKNPKIKTKTMKQTKIQFIVVDNTKKEVKKKVEPFY